jgi:hypothetical protein
MRKKILMGGTGGLIREAVDAYLRRIERRKLARELAAGYRANADLNQRLSEEFMHVDADNLEP